jgi:hypothetical protein
MLDPRPQEQCAQVLLHSSRADVQVTGYVFVTTALDEQIEHLLVPRRNLNLR